MNQKMNAHSADQQQDQCAEALIEQFVKAVAEHYKMELSVKIAHGKMANASSCHFNGGSVPYGYQIDDEKHYQINPDQTSVVQDLFRRFAAGVPMTELLRDLETKGVRQCKGQLLHPQDADQAALQPYLHWRIPLYGYRYPRRSPCHCGQGVV